MTENIAQPSINSPWGTVEDEAAFARCSPKLVYAAIARGDLRAARIGVGRGAWRIHREWTIAWLMACSEPREVSRG